MTYFRKWCLALLALLTFQSIFVSQACAMCEFFYLDRVMPTTVAQGSVSIQIVGNIPALEKIVKVSLFGPSDAVDQKEYEGTDINVSYDAIEDDNATKDALTATFDLSSAPKGKYDVTMQFMFSCFGDDTLHVASLEKVITVSGEGQGDLWVEMTGRTQVRMGAFSDYYIYYGNSGANDLVEGMFYIAIPAELKYELLFDPAPYQDFWTPKMKAEFGLVAEHKTVLGGVPYVLIPLRVKELGSGAHGMFKVRVNWGNTPSDHVLRAYWSGTKGDSYKPLVD